MANYLFIHGGKRNKKDWDAVREILESKDQETYAITLSDPENSSLSNHISEVCNLIKNENINDVILVGHSSAAFVITGVANEIPKKIAEIIYVDTLIPENGKSLFDFFHEKGVDTEKYGIPAWPPFVERLNFNESRIKKFPKKYLHCIHSQFLEMTRDIVPYIKKHAKQDNWRYFELNSDHYCMINNPKELAEIILK
ncbi:MAG: alpha/beta hydrolase [Bacteroidales bacterium]|nr:alpha/beta hydrolase [Bacteroidales bacterium]